MEKISNLAWLIVSLAIIAGSATYLYGSWAHPGPGFLPLWCGIIMAVLAVAVYIQETLKGRKEKMPQERVSFFTSRWPKLVVVLIILFAYALLIEPLGFILITFISMLALLKIVGLTKWRTALAEAALTTFLSYALFELGLKVLLPKGFWPRLFY